MIVQRIIGILFKHLAHKNLLSDGIDSYLPELLPKIDVSVTEKVILTSHVTDTIINNKTTGKPSTSVRDFSTQLYSLAMNLKSNLFIIDVSKGLENIEVHIV